MYSDKNSLVPHSNSLISFMDSLDWDVSPFEVLFDQFLNKTNPALSKELGFNFFENGAFPKVDIRETDTQYVIETEIPGLSKDQIKVEVKEDTLVIWGEKRSNEKKEGKYHRREIKRSSFNRSFFLSPEIVDKSTVKARFQNGLLEISIDKIKPIPPPKPEVRVIQIEDSSEKSPPKFQVKDKDGNSLFTVE